MTSDLTRRAESLAELGRLIYGTSLFSEQFALPELYPHFSSIPSVTVDSFIQKLADSDLVEFSSPQQIISKSLAGKLAFDWGCIPEIVLGPDLIRDRYSSAVFHVIAEKPGCGETGGTAFVSVDFPEYLVTARHVVEKYSLRRVEDHLGQTVSLSLGPARFPKNPNLDLALVHMKGLNCSGGFRIAWNSSPTGSGILLGSSTSQIEVSGRGGDKVLVFGFPPTAFHYPSLYILHAEIESRPRDYNSIDSLIISKGRPGCSGGPVIDYRGMVVGVVSESSQLVSSSLTTECIRAIPSGYLSDISREEP